MRWLAPALAMTIVACGAGGDQGSDAQDASAEADAPRPETETETGTEADAPKAETDADAIDADFSWDPLPLVEKGKIASGPFAGGYLVAPAGDLDWYFANLGLRAFVARIPDEVRVYMELYLSHLEGDFSIQDVTFSNPADPGAGTFSKKPEDSDDSYAATFLSLAVRWVRATHDRAWWDAHVATLKSIADANLVDSQQSNGLVHVFQSLAKDAVSYTEDNCEAYGGLDDFATLLSELGDADAAKYASAATKIAAAIDATMWLSPPDAFATVWNGATNPLGATFYPDAVTQAFPQAYAVPVAAGRWDAAWAYMNAKAPSWWTGTYDPSPFVILGWTAALRGDAADALAQQAHFRALTTSDPSAVAIHDLGFYERITLLLRDGVKL